MKKGKLISLNWSEWTERVLVFCLAWIVVYLLAQLVIVVLGLLKQV